MEGTKHLAINEAKKYYKIAMDEIKSASKNGKVELAVDGCEKGWLSLNLALKAMFLVKGVKPKAVPRSYRGTRYFLKKYGTRELRNIFDTAYGRLHIDGFWERDVDYERTLEIMEDIKEYIDKLEKGEQNGRGKRKSNK